VINDIEREVLEHYGEILSDPAEVDSHDAIVVFISLRNMRIKRSWMGNEFKK